VPVEGIPADIRRFIIEQIHSVEALEILLLLHEGSVREWSVGEVSERLRTSLDSARTRLAELNQGGLVEIIDGESPRYRFKARDEAAAERVRQLEQIYRERRVSVITLIYSKSSEQIRAFSDAFRLRKEDQ
jgi:predicted ArsR family transcriptional regulator